MGFSLQMFFEELEEMFNKDLNSEDLIIEIEEFIKAEKKYAQECGNIE